MNQKDMNTGIAIAVIALLAIGAVYLIVRISSVQDFGGRSVDNNPIQAAEDGNFDNIPGIQATGSVGTSTPPPAQ